MKLHEPIANFKPYAYPTGDVTQFFGSSHDLYFASVCYPDPHYTGGKYCLEGHNGWDIVRAWGTPIMSVCDGMVALVETSPTGYGKSVHIRNATDEWVYGHLSETLCLVGQQVKAGDVIGKMGNTGFVVSSQNAGGYWQYNPYAGTHLHLGRRPLKEGTNQVKDYYNGYYGYIAFSAEDFDLKQYQFAKDFGFLSMGEDVRQLQARLGVTQTGFFWLATRAAVKAYQAAHGIPTTGFVGPLTRASLNT